MLIFLAFFNIAPNLISTVSSFGPVTSDFVAPFHPDIDWSSCIVQVSEARVVSIPETVRSISKAEIRKRQISCAQLQAKVFGGLESQSIEDTDRSQFVVAMQLWAIRIKNALRKNREVSEGVLELV